MAKRRMAIITVLICLCFWLPTCHVMAASTSNTSKSINTNAACKLTLSYACDQTVFENALVKLYKIADVTPDFKYNATSKFERFELILNGIKSNSEWNVIRSTLDAEIVANNIQTDYTAKTNSNGVVCFTNLNPGLYLADVGVVSQNDITCSFDSALIALPGLNADGIWQYQVTVASKSEIITPSDEKIELKVLKLWKGDQEKNTRPKNIEVEIFCNNESYETIILSKDNNWTYTWSVKNDGSNWAVTEKNIPSGYIMTVEERDTTFVLTNTWEDEPKDPKPPQTGDTSNIMLYVILMIFSGSMLIIISIIGKRKTNEENK